MTRPHVRIHADNAYFGGSDAMIAVLARDASLQAAYDLSIEFRDNPRYREGLDRRVPETLRRVGLALPEVPSWAERFPAPVRPVAKAYSHATGLKRRFFARSVKIVTDELAAAQPDIMHVQNGGYPGAYSCLAAAVAAKQAGIPTLMVVNNIAKSRDEWRRRGDGPIDTRVAASVDAFVTGSAFAARALERVLGLPDGAVRNIPNGIPALAPVRSAAEVRAGMGVAADDLLVVVVATLEPRKGHAHLLQALARPELADAPVVVAIEGEGTEAPRLHELAAALGVSDRVRFLGRIPEVVSLMAAADVLALPSVGAEDFPNVILEAMQLGTPVVASRVAGVPEQVVDGVTGTIVEPGDEAALASALAELVDDAALRSRMGAAGAQRFGEHFTAERAAAAYKALYDELLGR